MIATSISSEISSNLVSSSLTTLITSKFCLEQLGQATIFTPLLLRFKDFKISQPTLTSSTGSEASEILIVSPIPSDKSIPMPIEDFTDPARNVPDSVIPKCNG